MKLESEKKPTLQCPVPTEQLPAHVAIIMDGNGRWAVRRDQPRIVGHHQGAKTVKAITTTCAELGLKQLTLYSFSRENWKRPADEVQALMQLYRDYLIQERQTMMENNICFRVIGRRDRLPHFVLEEMDRSIEMTAKHEGLTLCLALNYGARVEITDAVRAISRKVERGDMTARDVNESTIEDHLYTANMPDPDLLIRTAGEMRISNFLLWQISYAEMYVTDVLWPQFSDEHLFDAFKEYALRRRRYGGLDESVSKWA